MMLRVLIVADDALSRSSLTTALASTDIMVVGALDADADLPTAMATLRPDVTVWDVPPDAAPGGLGLSALAEFGVPVLALCADGPTASALSMAGARGCLTRDVEPERLVAAVRAVAEDLIVVDPDFDQHTQTPGEDAELEELTARERGVLQLLAEGLSNKEIAGRLRISENTVKFHINTIFGKLGVHSRTEAVTRAARLGLILL